MTRPAVTPTAHVSTVTRWETCSISLMSVLIDRAGRRLTEGNRVCQPPLAVLHRAARSWPIAGVGELLGERLIGAGDVPSLHRRHQRRRLGHELRVAHVSTDG